MKDKTKESIQIRCPICDSPQVVLERCVFNTGYISAEKNTVLAEITNGTVPYGVDPGFTFRCKGWGDTSGCGYEFEILIILCKGLAVIKTVARDWRREDLRKRSN